MGQQGTLHGPVPDEVHGLAGQEVQTVAVALIPGHQQLVLGGAQADDGLEHQPLALLDVLAHGVEVGGELHAGGEQALAVLTLALAVELLPPFAHEPEGGIVAAQDLHGAAGAVQLIADGGVLPGGAIKGRGAADLHHLGGAAHQLIDVHAGDGNGQQAHGGEDGVAAAHLVWHHEGLPALGVRQGFQRAPGLVGGGVNAALGALTAVFVLQQLAEEAEGHGGLGGGAGLGDDIHGEVIVPQQVDDLLHGVGAEAVAHEVDVGGVFLFQVVVGGAQALDDATGTQVASADADDHQGLGIALDLGGSGLDAGELLLVVVPGQVHPAGEFAAGAGGVLQLLMGNLQPGSQCLLVGHGQERLHLKQFDIQHDVSVLSFVLGRDALCLTYFYIWYYENYNISTASAQEKTVAERAKNGESSVTPPKTPSAAPAAASGRR